MTGPITVGVGPPTRGTGGIRGTAGVDAVDDLRGQFLHHGRYRLLDLLGLGGPSEVWLAHDAHLDRQVAIKTLRADAGGTWAELTAHEAKTLAQIDHPHVVPIYDSFVERDKPWIVMKFIRGRTLADILEAEGPLPEDKLWDVARAISSALAASHRAGIVHRDLKPANVMIGPDNTIWLVDFGIALRSRAGAAGPPAAGTVAVGTLAYMAPECLSGRPDRPADLWSLGVLLVTLATGVNPFQRPDKTSTVGAIVNGPLPDLPVPSLLGVVHQLLQRDAARRPTAADLADQLRAGVPDRIPEVSGGLFRRWWPRQSPSSGAPAGRSAGAAPPAAEPAFVEPPAQVDPPPVPGGPQRPATRADSRLAFWGMSQVIDHPLDPALGEIHPPAGSGAASPAVLPAGAVPPLVAVLPTVAVPPAVVPAAVPPPADDWAATGADDGAADWADDDAGAGPDDAAEPAVRPRRDRRSPSAVARRAAGVTLPVLGGWAVQSVAAFAGLMLGLLCLVPFGLTPELASGQPTLAWLLGGVVAAVAATCLAARAPSASSGRWLTITVGWALLVSVGTSAALQLGPIPAAIVPLVILGVAGWAGRAYAPPHDSSPDPHEPGAPDDGTDHPRTRPPGTAAATVTAVAATAAVAVGPAAANGVLVLTGARAATTGLLLVAWVVGLIGVAAVPGRRAGGASDAIRTARLQHLLITCIGVGAAFTTTVVLAVGRQVWREAFGPSAGWSDASRWWAYGLAALILTTALAGQVRLGRGVRAAGGGASGRPGDRNVSGLGVLLLGSLAAALVGAAAGVGIAEWTDLLVVPALLFVVPAVAGAYVAGRAACARLADDPPGPVDQRNPARYLWWAGWTGLLVLVSAAATPALAALLPHLDAAGLAVAAAILTVVVGVAGQVPADRAFGWARRQTGESLAEHAVRLAAQLAAAAVGGVIAMVVLDQVDEVGTTPPGFAVAVAATVLGIVVVDLARTSTMVGCAILGFGVAAALVAACWVQTALVDLFGDGPWGFPRVVVFLTALVGVGVTAVYAMRFAAELTRNTRGERANHAFTALLFAAVAAGVVYGMFVLAGIR